MAAGLATDGWKRSLDDYLLSARALLSAMVQTGFDHRFALPVDTDGEILAGSHRLGCALALDLKDVPVIPSIRAWAPSWGRAWFIDNGMAADDLARLAQDWQSLYDRHPR